jgi:peptide/nickel transport system substrate-binding protein
MLRAISRVEVVDALTLRLHSTAPAPNLPGDLANIAIVSRHAGEQATTEDYNSGKAAIGTGPYRLVSFERGAKIELARNEAWWGARPEWAKVTLRGMSNAGTRVAALLANDVDVIDNPPIAALAQLRGDSRVRISATQGLRVIFLGPDHTHAEGGPFLTDAAGAPLAKNPLLDRRVRQALSLGINRAALTDRVMQGTATPTGQWMPPGTSGYTAAIPAPAFAPEEARRLLAEAGYPQGFHMTFHAPNDRYPNDAETAQAIGQMWTRIGVVTRVEILPGAIYAPRGLKHEFPMGLWGWSNNTAEAGYVLVNILGSVTPGGARGVSNVSGYANPALDALTDRALATIDATARDALLVEAVHMAVDDMADIPLFHLVNSWATRRDLTYDARADEQTVAMGVHSAK